MSASFGFVVLTTGIRFACGFFSFQRSKQNSEQRYFPNSQQHSILGIRDKYLYTISGLHAIMHCIFNLLNSEHVTKRSVCFSFQFRKVSFVRALLLIHQIF